MSDREIKLGRRSLWVEPINQLACFFSECNWYDVYLIHVAFELSPYKGSKEITVVLLGLGVSLVLVDNESEERKQLIGEIEASRDRFLAEHESAKGE